MQLSIECAYYFEIEEIYSTQYRDSLLGQFLGKLTQLFLAAIPTLEHIQSFVLWKVKHKIAVVQSLTLLLQLKYQRIVVTFR